MHADRKTDPQAQIIQKLKELAAVCAEGTNENPCRIEADEGKIVVRSQERGRNALLENMIDALQQCDMGIEVTKKTISPHISIRAPFPISAEKASLAFFHLTPSHDTQADLNTIDAAINYHKKLTRQGGKPRSKHVPPTGPLQSKDADAVIDYLTAKLHARQIDDISVTFTPGASSDTGTFTLSLPAESPNMHKMGPAMDELKMLISRPGYVYENGAREEEFQLSQGANSWQIACSPRQFKHYIFMKETNPELLGMMIKQGAAPAR